VLEVERLSQIRNYGRTSLHLLNKSHLNVLSFADERDREGGGNEKRKERKEKGRLM
jgi:hypothetical protein